jgi:hypothetical protein
MLGVKPAGLREGAGVEIVAQVVRRPQTELLEGVAVQEVAEAPQDEHGDEQQRDEIDHLRRRDAERRLELLEAIMQQPIEEDPGLLRLLQDVLLAGSRRHGHRGAGGGRWTARGVGSIGAIGAIGGIGVGWKQGAESRGHVRRTDLEDLAEDRLEQLDQDDGRCGVEHRCAQSQDRPSPVLADVSQEEREELQASLPLDAAARRTFPEPSGPREAPEGCEGSVVRPEAARLSGR